MVVEEESRRWRGVHQGLAGFLWFVQVLVEGLVISSIFLEFSLVNR
jgi:hypothetical protein